MTNFEIKKSGRKCFECEREIKPGEEFFSALIEIDESATERHDYCDEHWDGPPEDCLGWWKGQVPEIDKGRIYWAPKQVLLAYFEHASSNPQTTDIAYVTGLLLVQKKILTMADSDDPSLLVLVDRATKSTFEITVPEIAPERMTEIQDELSERLFMDQPIDDEVEPEMEND